MSTTKLRDHLLAILKNQAGPRREFHLHVLLTSPRKSNALFPFAKPKPPRAYLQDLLVLASEGEVGDEAGRVLVCAIEIQVYHVATTESAVVYVSKVDSTGMGAKPAPTAAMVRGVLGFYLDPRTRPITAKHVWVQLFARAQGHYLFPNSKEYEGKKWLGDTQLCAWWRRVLTRVAADVEGRVDKIGLWYMLPGQSEDESTNLLRLALGTRDVCKAKTSWVYGHPYKGDIPLPCPKSDEENLGFYIPYFDDCPKARFLDELAHADAPPRKRARLEVPDSPRKRAREREGSELRVSVDEFWERMSFRQECVSGAVTGFFALAVSCTSAADPCSPLAPESGQVSGMFYKRVLTMLTTMSEFGRRADGVKATETVERAIRGLCEEAPVPREPVDVPKTPPRRTVALPDVSPNPFAEPSANLEQLAGRVVAEGRAAAAATEAVEHVRVLSVRKKNKS